MLARVFDYAKTRKRKNFIEMKKELL